MRHLAQLYVDYDDSSGEVSLIFGWRDADCGHLRRRDVRSSPSKVSSQGSLLLIEWLLNVTAEERSPSCWCSLQDGSHPSTTTLTP